MASHRAQIWWLSSPDMTVTVTVDDHGTVIHAAPIVRAFIGQPISNLTRWLQRQGECRFARMGQPSDG